jgi:hypothetical protein
MDTKKVNNIILGFITIFVFVVFIPVAQAENIDMMSCGVGNVNVIVASEDLTIMAMEGKGINLDNYGNKTFDNTTYHYGALFKIDKGNWSGSMVCKYMDPSGDIWVVDITQVGMERDWKFIYGTGKYKGITGGGKAVPNTKGKPISPGTTQGCFKITGTYELKK